MIGMSIKRISVPNLCHVLKAFVKSTPGFRILKLHETETKPLLFDFTWRAIDKNSSFSRSIGNLVSSINVA